MDIILLERVAKLGQMGQVVSVKDGYARNFLLPQGKALRVNAANMARFEAEKAQLEARNLETKKKHRPLQTSLTVSVSSSSVPPLTVVRFTGRSRHAMPPKPQQKPVSASTKVRSF